MWNYRIIKFKDHVGLYETIYNDAGEICAYSEKPELVGDNVEELGETLKLMLHDYNRHVADPEQVLIGPDIKFGKFYEPDDELIPFTTESLNDHHDDQS